MCVGGLVHVEGWVGGWVCDYVTMCVCVCVCVCACVCVCVCCHTFSPTPPHPHSPRRVTSGPTPKQRSPSSLDLRKQQGTVHH